ncbi:MAG TPA: hypothetical protein VGL04_12860, partial [Sporichthyaceae bacterium]
MGARLSKRVLTTGAIAGALTLITAGAVAAAPTNPFRHDGGLIAACVGPDGAARITRSFQHCRPGERELVWNEQGRPGIQGPTGATGGTGAQGIQGIPGPSLNPFSPLLQDVQGPIPTDFAVTGAETSVDGLSITLPGANATYLISANVRGRVAHTTGAALTVAHNCFLSAGLALDTTAIPDTQRVVITDMNPGMGIDDVQATAPIQ